MSNVEEKLKIFVNEINDIQDADLKKLAKSLIENADDYFFTVAASSSGKYHPPFDLGDGGLIRHTRCVIFMAESVAESLNMTQYDKDCLIVAALAHDIKKQGDGSGSHTVWEHPTYAKDYLYAVHKTSKSKVPKDVIDKIAGAIESHMGKWGHDSAFCKGNKPLPMPETEFEKALQIADYIASRKEITDFKFRPTEVTTSFVSNKNEKKLITEMSLAELEMYEMPFGKHKGKTLKEIKPTGYLDWVVSQTDFNNKETQDIVKAYFDKLREFVTSDGREKVKQENIDFKKEQTNLSQEELDDLPF